MIENPSIQGKTSFLGKNQSTGIYVLIQGILIGFGGMAHGIFETLQGNTPTGGYLISFGIFTVIPNYLLTGITAILFSLSVIVWTIFFMHIRNGPIVFFGTLNTTLFSWWWYRTGIILYPHLGCINANG